MCGIYNYENNMLPINFMPYLYARLFIVYPIILVCHMLNIKLRRSIIAFT